MEINMKRFKFIEHTRKDTGVKEVIALTHYCGETVEGVATCSPADTYDFEVGKKLATLRCNMKIAEKRAEKACTNEFAIMKEIDRLLHERKKANERTSYAAGQYENAAKELSAFYESLT